MSTREALSKTPSWMMLGFVVGCVVALTVQRQWDNREKAASAEAHARLSLVPAPTPTPTPPLAPPGHASLADLEAIFQRWETHAVWRNDVTEVAFWDPSTNQFSEYVEVLRNGDDLYFRTIPHLTRPLIEEDLPKEAPLRFTEPESVHQERRRLRFTFPNQ